MFFLECSTVWWYLWTLQSPGIGLFSRVVYDGVPLTLKALVLVNLQGFTISKPTDGRLNP